MYVYLSTVVSRVPDPAIFLLNRHSAFIPPQIVCTHAVYLWSHIT